MSMKYFLSADIGGTKTLLQLTAADRREPLLQKAYASAAYAGLADMLDAFLAEAGVSDIAAACLAVAGPVSGRVVKLTNLPWTVDGDALAARFGIRQVALLNDFAAAGHGIAALQAADLLCLQTGKPQAQGVRLVLGAGTGLGVAWLSAQDGNYQVHPSEAGHMDFAPVDEMQCMLLRYLQQRHGHVSYERIVSGPGLLAIYEFMRETGLASVSPRMLAALAGAQDAAAVITQFSQQGDETIARMVVDLFLSIYGAFAGNMALATLPHGGIYITGGIAAKIAAQMQRGQFLEAFWSKGRYEGLLITLPIHIVLNEKMGLMGASLLAQREG
ncbi:MAG: glucokinase [Gallionellales bacterium 35-53-114]|jgi:glucokinase|nr:MAG: glucokinase [Gallionellales bacterium 35-53-114]OYZ62421.1 MAG: glucokinase [Gallionellales bacterium 24-53-125]OZB08482.1 MAG: glucokinase [Gallionellales bacterium 39-52-133]HQS59447.1 glucokinase [Gallionellaceae bacterium]HQS76360.1 glucokinase [Gallionellaceae bacterium]